MSIAAKLALAAVLAIPARHDHVTSGFAFQVRYLGASVGGERVRAFADLGIGFEGLIVGGLTHRF